MLPVVMKFVVFTAACGAHEADIAKDADVACDDDTACDALTTELAPYGPNTPEPVTKDAVSAVP